MTPAVGRGLVLAALAGLIGPAAAHKQSPAHERLPIVGRAPDFTLVAHSGEPFSAGELHGKVSAVTFIYATCKDACPVLTSKLVQLQRKLGADFPARVRFVAITVDPAVDTPEVLTAYAAAMGADPRGWKFLTGSPEQVQRVVADFGAFARKNQGGDVDHLYLTSLIDRNGAMRVQYLGYRFDADEMLRDLRKLLRE